jgi:hypothetical protein
MSVRDLMARVRADVSGFQSGMQKVTQGLDNVANTATKVSGAGSALSVALGGLGAMGIGLLAQRAVSAVGDLATLGANSEQLRGSFEDLASGAGGSSEAILSAIRRATDGTVSDLNIIQAANKGILLGLGANAEQWEQLTEVARVRARAMGRDVTSALDDITTGIGRESRMILDNLGIILDMDRVQTDYADSIGKTADQLTDYERKQAIVNGVIEEGQRLMAESGGLQMSNADKIAAMGAAWENLKETLAVKVAPAIADTAVAITNLIQLLGSDLPTAMSNAAGQAEATGGSFRDMAEAARDAKADMMIIGKGTVSGIAGIDIQESIHLTGEELIQVGEIAGATDLEIVEMANSMGVELPAGFAAAAASTAAYAGQAAAMGVAVSTATDAIKGQAGALQQLSAAQILANAMAGDHPWTAMKDKTATSPVPPPMLSQEDLVVLAEARADIADLIALNKEAGEAAEKAAKDGASAWKTAWEDLRGTVRSALTATSATSADFDATAMGTYVDQWDEDARRLDAIAARGFEELKAHADWAGVLKIPSEVLSGSEAALKEWAARTSVDVRELARPDLLKDNLDTMVQRVKDYMAREQAIELTVDMVAGRLAAEGGGMTKEQVAEALGFTAPKVAVGLELGTTAKDDLLASLTGAEGEKGAGVLTVPIQLAAQSETGEAVDLSGAGTGMGALLIGGLSAAMADYQITVELKAAIDKNIDKNGGLLNDAGFALWKQIEPGIKKAIWTTPYAEIFAQHLAPYVADILIHWGGLPVGP